MFTLFVFLIILGLLVLSHEAGHFVAARKSGMKVYEFGFGFPPRAFGVRVLTKLPEEDDSKEVGLLKQKKPIKKYKFISGRGRVEDMPVESGWEGGTIYSMNWFPLGGFVRIKGEEGQESGPDSFVSKSFTRKAIVLVSGVAMNVLLAAVIFSIGFMVGLPQALDGVDNSLMVKDRKLQIMQILPNKPAESAGLKVGDSFLKIGEIVSPTLEQMQEYVNANKDSEITFQIERGSELIEKTIKPEIYIDTGKGGIGVAISEVGMVKYPWHKAIYNGFLMTFIYLKEILIAFYFIIKGLFAGNGAGAAVSGPIGIAVMTGQIAKLGIPYLLNFTAILSLNLAIINILPLPALDGGRLLFLAFGRIFKRDVPLKFEQLAHTLGFLALMALVIVITVKDISRFSNVFTGLFNKLF
ncbi:MAG: M50 family metallopeptidase [bacterium]